MATNEAPDQSSQTQPAGFELEQVDVYSKYILRTPLEIMFILRSMQKRGSMATIYFNGGRSFFLTCILGFSGDDKYLVLDASIDKELNREAAEASRLILNANLDTVKIQFGLTGLRQTTFNGKFAFLAPIPDSLLRLQRREYFRLENSYSDPVRCLVPDAKGLESTELILFDISGGGLSLKVPKEKVEVFKTGALFRNCRLYIPEEPAIFVDLCVRNSIITARKDGHEYLRIGCEFVNLPGTRLNLIQRYITKVERERKSKMAGL